MDMPDRHSNACADSAVQEMKVSDDDVEQGWAKNQKTVLATAEQQWDAVSNNSTVFGEMTEQDNEYHMALLLEPEWEVPHTPHTATLLSEIMGEEDFDFEMEID